MPYARDPFAPVDAPMEPLLLFGLDTSHDYAARVAAGLGSTLAALEEQEFPDGEHRCRPLAPVRGRRVAVLHTLHADGRRSVNDKLCRLLFCCAALKDAGAAAVIAVVPYLCYARSDRRTQPAEAVVHRYVATAMEACGIDEVLALDVHNVAAFENAFRCPVHNIESAGLFARHFASLPAGLDAVSVSPDTGGIQRAERFRASLERTLGRAVGGACVQKHRSGTHLTSRLLVGEVRGRAAIIVDDMVSTGATLRHAVRACRDAGAARIFAAVAHGLFSGGAADLLSEPGLEHIAVLDAVAPLRLAPELVARHLRLLDSAELIAGALRAATSH